eukprot:gene5898-8138_t
MNFSLIFYTVCLLLFTCEINGYLIHHNYFIRHVSKIVAEVQSVKTTTNDNEDYYQTFPMFDKLLFHRFSDAVANEFRSNFNSSIEQSSIPTPTNYKDLISMINNMTFTSSKDIVNKQSKRMLVRLFPPGLLPAYNLIFSNLFPDFSAYMNTYVTKWTTNWLMGNAIISDVINPVDGSIIRKDNCLIIEKCRFLETAGCVRTCLHACKIPTQNFFKDEMGLPVFIKPNLTDYSCKFEFGIEPIPLEIDSSLLNLPCLSTCTANSKQSSCK